MRAKRGNDDLYKSPTECTTPSKASRITRQTTMFCKICKKNINILSSDDDDEVIVTCKKCYEKYHGACSGISATFYRNMIEKSTKGWLCYNCNQDSFAFLNSFNEKWNALVETVETHEMKLNTLASSTQNVLITVDERVSAFEARMNAQMESVKKCLAEHELKLNERVPSPDAPPMTSQTSRDLTYIKDLQRRNNLVIQHVPAINDENQDKLKAVVKKLANSCGCDVRTTDITSVIRLRKGTSTNGNQGTSTNGNAILVKFIDVAIKDEIFRGYIRCITNKNPITSSALGFDGNQRIFVNQHLSSDLMKVKMAAVRLKQIKRISKITACYNVVRILHGDKWIKVYNMQQLHELFPDITD